MENEIMKVVQLPVIEEQLHKVKAEVEGRINEALSLACSVETVKDVKSVRAQLNKEFEEYETFRKEIKRKISEPYMSFENTYNECIRDLFKTGDKQLKEKIDDVESVVKEEKEMAVRTYFEEYKAANGVDCISFEDVGLKVNLTASEKSLKKQCKDFIDRVIKDLEMINSQEFSDEILVEYKKSYDVSSAILTVTNRHKAIEAEKKRQQEMAAFNEQKVQAEEKVDEVLSAPTEEAIQETEPEPTQETVYELSFKVRTKDINKLRELKIFLVNGGYEYEQL